jgi:hypothetical protein
MEFLESAQERNDFVSPEFFQAEVLAKVTFSMQEKNLALRVMREDAYYSSLPRNLNLDFICGKPKKVIEHMVSVIKLTTLKALIESIHWRGAHGDGKAAFERPVKASA